MCGAGSVPVAVPPGIKFGRPGEALRTRPRRRPRPRIQARGVMELGVLKYCALSELRPRSGLEMLSGRDC